MTGPQGAGRRPLTPSQTVGPFLSIGLDWADGEHVVPPDTAGAITITGLLLDGAGEPVTDGLVETWQADPDGRFTHPDDPCGPAPPGGRYPGFRGFGRSLTGPDGRWRIVTLRPGPVPTADGVPQAPHLDVSVFARGLLDRVVTRIYFPDDGASGTGLPDDGAFGAGLPDDGAPALDADPVLRAVPADRRPTLIAKAEGADRYRFDIRLQGEQETVFFDL